MIRVLSVRRGKLSLSGEWLTPGNHHYIARNFSTSSLTLLPPLTLGIRRETKNRWERRVPLSPGAVQRLIQETSTKVLVQPSTKRIFVDDTYRQVKSGESLSYEPPSNLFFDLHPQLSFPFLPAIFPWHSSIYPFFWLIPFILSISLDCFIASFWFHSGWRLCSR